jgi:hypothetical protein
VSGCERDLACHPERSEWAQDDKKRRMTRLISKYLYQPSVNLQ